MSSTHAASRIDNGAKTRVRPPHCTCASSTDLVFPVPGSEVIRQRELLVRNFVVSS